MGPGRTARWWGHRRQPDPTEGYVAVSGTRSAGSTRFLRPRREGRRRPRGRIRHTFAGFRRYSAEIQRTHGQGSAQRGAPPDHGTTSVASKIHDRSALSSRSRQDRGAAFIRVCRSQ